MMSYPWDTYRQGYLQQQNILNQSYLQGNKTNHPISTMNTHVNSQPLKGPTMPHSHIVQVPNYGINTSLPNWTSHQGQYSQNVHWNKQEKNSHEKFSTPWSHFPPQYGNNSVGQTNSSHVHSSIYHVDSDRNKSQTWSKNQHSYGHSPIWKQSDNEQKVINYPLNQNNIINYQIQAPSNFLDTRIKGNFMKPNANPTFGQLIRPLNSVQNGNNSNIPSHAQAHLPPPPLPQEEPPPPPPPFPPPRPPFLLPLSNTVHYNKLPLGAKWNTARNVQQLHTPVSQAQQENINLKSEKQPSYRTIMNLDVQPEFNNDETKQREAKQNDSFSSQSEKNLNAKVVTHSSEEDNRFVDALSQLKGLSKQWTTSPNSTKRTRNQKKKDRKRQKRKEERTKLMELVKEPDEEYLSDFEVSENPSDRGYQLSDYGNHENTLTTKENSPSRIQQHMTEENPIKTTEIDKAQDEEMEISDCDENEITRDNKSKQQIKENKILSTRQEGPRFQYQRKHHVDITKTLDVSPSKVQHFNSLLKSSKILSDVEEETKEKEIHDEKLKLPSLPDKLHISLPDSHNEMKGDINLLSYSSKKSVVASTHEESLTEKKERLARALKRIAFENAKVKLKMAHKKKQEILANASYCQRKMPVSESSKFSSTNKVTKNINQINEKITLGDQALPPESSSVPPSKRERIDQRLNLSDITAYRSSHLVIRNIGCSGPQDKVRVNANKSIFLDSTDEENISEDQLSDEDGKVPDRTTSSGVDPINVVQAKVNLYKTASTAKDESVPSSQTKQHPSQTEMKSKSMKQNLQLLKSRLRLKLMEKARLERKRKFNSDVSNESSPKKQLKNNDTEESHQRAKDGNIKENNIHMKENCLNTNSSEILSLSLSTLLSDSLKPDDKKTVDFVSKTDTKSKVFQREETESDGKATRKKSVFLLKERQRILKDNIDTSKINQRELKYNMDISSLNNLVNRQKESLAKQGKKISKNTSMIKECCKELNQDKQSIVISEKRIEVLQKRKRLMEKMLLTVTKKLIDGRKNRNEFLSLRTRSKRKKVIHPHLDRTTREVEETII